MNHISLVPSITLEPTEDIINSKHLTNSERKELATKLYYENKFVDSAKIWITVSDKSKAERLSLIYAIVSYSKSICTDFDLNEINSILSVCQIKMNEFPQYKNHTVIAHCVYKRYAPLIISDLNKKIEIVSKKFEFFLWSKNHDKNCSLHVLHPELIQLIGMNFLAMTADFKDEIFKMDKICSAKI